MTKFVRGVDICHWRYYCQAKVRLIYSKDIGLAHRPLVE